MGTNTLTMKTNLVVNQKLVDGLSSNIFLATDPVQHRQVVVKVVPVDHPEAKQELLVAERLRDTHTSHIITYESAFVQDDSLFLVMEACPRGDLHTMLDARNDPRLPEPEALQLWRQIIQGVIFLHDRDIAHRDLSLENMLVGTDGHIKLCDFGLSTFTDQDRLSTGRVGKLYYMAPEVVADVPYDAKKADLWSLGIVLFILLTGSPLVETASPSDPLYRALEKIGVMGILKHWRLDHEISSPTITLLERLLRIVPSERPPSVRELFTDLQIL